MKTKEEIQSELKKLKELLPNIHPTSALGTDNKAKLAAQINVLENTLDDYDIDDEYDRSGIDEAILLAAFDAGDWLDGNHCDDTLSENWEKLRQ